MNIGSFSIEILSEGRFEIFADGHINRSLAEEEDPQTVISRSDSSVVGINPILVQTGSCNILLDAGLGWGLDAGSSYKEASNVRTNLEIFGLSPGDISHVILSHLHYDHAAGCSFTNSDFGTEPTFPNASYYVHQQEWQHAITQIDQQSKLRGANYQLDDFYRLIANNNLELLEGSSTQIVPGITTILTGGHTPGHQAIIMNSNSEMGYYLGDLLPSSKHLNQYRMEKMDYNPIEAKKRKIQLLRSAFEEKACLFFYHSQYSQVGSLEKNKDKRYVLKEL